MSNAPVFGPLDSSENFGLCTDWLARGAGVSLLADETRLVGRAVDSVFGDYFLQIGGWGGAGRFRGLARTRRAAVLATAARPGVDVIGADDDLPVASDSVDVVLLPHALEAVADPHALLREVDRVLRPDGHVVVLGFNALSWWGARHYLSRRRFPSGIQRMIAEYRLRDWFRLLDYGIVRVDYYGFIPPLYRPAAPAPVDTASETGLPSASASVPSIARWPWLAGCYLMMARKEVLTLTPIRPVFRRPAQLVGGLVNPTTRNAA